MDVSAGRRDAPRGESTDFFLSFAQQIWIGGERGLRMTAARKRRSAAEAEAEYQRTTTAADARETYFDLLIAERAVETAAQLVAVAGRIVALNEQRLRLGEGTRIQVNAAAIGAARARATLAEAERRVVQARLRLNLLLGEAPSREFVTEGRLQPAPVPLRQADQLVQLALERRSDLQAAAQRVAARRSEQRLAQKLLIPEPTLYGYYEQEQDDEVLGAGMSLPLPLFYRYEGEQRIAAAELAREKTERELLQLQVEQQVLGALADYRAAALQVEAVGEAMLEAALENVQLVQRAVAAGTFAAPALTSAQDNYLSVRETYLNALRALAAAGSVLERATGGLVALGELPEVEGVYSRVGRPEVGGDPALVNVITSVVTLPKLGTWSTGRDYAGVQTTVTEALNEGFPGVNHTLSQPIQMRSNELITGVLSQLVAGGQHLWTGPGDAARAR